MIFQSQHGYMGRITVLVHVHSAMRDSEKRIAASNANKSAGTTQWQWGCKFLTVFLFVSLSSAVRLSFTPPVADPFLVCLQASTHFAGTLEKQRKRRWNFGALRWHCGSGWLYRSLFSSSLKCTLYLIKCSIHV